MGYASLLKPRAETLAGEIEGIIDLANLADSRRRKLEARPDLLAHRRVAVSRGRVQTHPPGPAGSRLYKHGGLSLMEMLTPWIVLESAGRAA